MENNFVTAEEVSAEQDNVKTLYRFVSSLTLLKRVFVPTLLMIVLAAATPPYFLWFLGEMIACADNADCSVAHTVFDLEIVVPATVSTLLMIAVFAMITRVAAWMSFELSGQWATQGIQARMMESISGVRTTFFDENPSGRLINRLLGDYGMLRLEGVMSIGDTTNGLAEVLCVGLLIMVGQSDRRRLDRSDCRDLRGVTDAARAHDEPREGNSGRQDRRSAASGDRPDRGANHLYPVQQAAKPAGTHP